jgi:hypothetical protein
MQREEALAMQEEKAGISEKSLVKVSADLDVKGEKPRLLTKSTSTRWKHTSLMPSTPLALTRCCGRRRSSLMRETGT